MFNNKKIQKIDEIDTIIGPGTKFVGNIEAIGIVRVDGEFRGNIVTKGDVIIGDNGILEGDVSARNMVVAGNSGANINCSEKLQIKADGKVSGDIVVKSIIIEENAVFNGKCSMRSNKENVKEASNE